MVSLARLVIKTELPDAYHALRKLGVDKDGAVQSFVTRRVMENLPDFMPRDSGNLINSMAQRSKSLIRIATPYARFLFFGVTRSGANVDYSKQKNPQGGAHWDRRMAQARGAAIAAEATRYAKKGRR